MDDDRTQRATGGKKRLLHAFPDPAEGVGKDGAAVFAVVGAVAHDELVVVVFVFEGGSHLLVGERPVAELIVEICGAVLKENANGFAFGFANECFVVMAAADVGEAADVADDFAELVGSFPGDREGADAAGTHAADGTRFGFLAQLIFLFHFGQNFLEEKAGILIGERVVFEAAIIGAKTVGGKLIASVARIDEDADGDGHFAFVNEVIEDDGGAEFTCRV